MNQYLLSVYQPAGQTQPPPHVLQPPAQPPAQRHPTASAGGPIAAELLKLRYRMSPSAV